MYFKTMSIAFVDIYIKRKILRWYFSSDIPVLKKLINFFKQYEMFPFLNADGMPHVTYYINFEFKKLIF